MKNIFKLMPCVIFMSFACAIIAEVEEPAASVEVIESAEASKAKDDCAKRAYRRALELNIAIDATFPLLVPATAQQGSGAFASFFDEKGVFQSPGGVLRGKTAIFEGFLAYAQDPGEMNQHVVIRKTYWDPTTATLVVERTWFATLTAPRDFCGTTLNAGDTYSQDDAVVIRFACEDCNRRKDCVLPGKVVYYREYFDPNQFQSNFISDYPAPCARLAS